MDPLSPSIHSRRADLGATTSAPRERAEVLESVRAVLARVPSLRPDPDASSPRAALPSSRPRVVGACDTPVDPLQLIGLLGREPVDVANF
ncbi:MAG: hypothetical protein IPJ77_00595 [Planctomycetes bacterium]|nr:hypothetical protein [Planctomycetota bacterium]